RGRRRRCDRRSEDRGARLWSRTVTAAVAIVIALHIEELADLSLDEARPVIESVERSLRAVGFDAVLDDPSFGCETKDRCAEEVRARASAAEVLFMRATSGPTRIQLRLDRIRGAEHAALEVLLDRTPGQWDRELASAIRQLYPEAKPPTVATAPPLFE